MTPGIVDAIHRWWPYLDTAQIARVLRVSEHLVYNALDEARAERNLEAADA